MTTFKTNVTPNKAKVSHFCNGEANLMKLEIRETDYIAFAFPKGMKWVSVDSLQQYIRNLETSNEMYGKDAQDLFDDLNEKLEEK